MLVLAVAGFAVSEGRAQVGVPAGRSTLATWQAERAFYLNMTLQRAKSQLNDTLVKVEIGTMAPIDVDGARQAVAQIDALIKADSARTSAPTNRYRCLAA